LKIKDKGEIIKYSLPVLGVTIIFSILTQADMVLVKHYFLAQQAGLYASAAVLGRAILYLPAAIIIALFPMVTELHSLNKDASHILKKGLVYTALLAGGGVLLFWIMPEFLLGFLFGQRYLAAAPLLGIFGLAMFPMAMLGILISFNLARNQVKLIYPLLVGAIIQITLIHFYHQTLNQVLWIIVGMGTLLFITNLGMILRDKDSNAD
jgi:O-antigen/teichoic acid export membrane protein